MLLPLRVAAAVATFVSAAWGAAAWAQDDPKLFPPKLPGDKPLVTVSSPALLQPTPTLKPGVAIAAKPATVDVMFYPGQTYPGRPWSCWGDGSAVGDKYYSAIGDHLAPQGNAFVYEYDSSAKSLRLLTDTTSVINLPEGHYLPGKIHSRVDLGSDGWLYYGTHRGSTRVTTAQYHYQGDWILRTEPKSGRTEIVAHAPLPNQCLPTSVLDPERLIFYGGTADGDPGNNRVKFLAFDVKQGKLLAHRDDGPRRCLIFAPSSGRVYWVPKPSESGGGDVGKLVRFDPAQPDRFDELDAVVGLRAATAETADGLVYTADRDRLFAFNTKTETARELGPLVVGGETYVATLDVCPATGRYLYFVAGAHGGSQRDGAPLVQYDVQTNRRKVIAFMHPAVTDATGFMPMGTYGLAVSPAGEKVYITWNGNIGGADSRGRVNFNACALAVVHIPEEERQP